MSHQQLLGRLARENDSKIVLLVLDGVGDLRSIEQPQTALDAAQLPNFDALATRSALGRIIPVADGITPGSGPGHLALFGYDPRQPEVDIGRGVLEALGLGLDVGPNTVAVRGNFATADADGRLLDRRAGRIATEECERLCKRLDTALAATDLGARIFAGEGHRFVLLLSGEGLSAEIADTDPQRLEVPPLDPVATVETATATVALVRRVIAAMEAELAGEERANRVLLRGFSTPPHLPQLDQLHRARFGAFAGYPLYRGVAAACGMQVVECGKRIDSILDQVEASWADFDYFFLHVKQTDQAGEDGNLAAKVEVLEEVDRALPRLLDLSPDVLAVTGDHSTPAPMAAHSWHPVPVLIAAPCCYIDEVDTFTEQAAIGGHLGTFPSRRLMGMMLANAGRLAKFGA